MKGILYDFKCLFTVFIILVLFINLGYFFNISTIKSVNASDLGNGDLVMYWSNQEGVLNKPISSTTNETYKESDRQWLGLPTIARTRNGRLWCAFQTGDLKEGSEGINNYDVMYYSDDNGVTWSNEYAIFDVADDDIRLTDPRLFTDSDGILWLILIRGGAKGTYAIELKNPDCENPSENLQFEKPIWWLNYPPAHRPTILSNGRWITPVEASVKNQHTYICTPNAENRLYVWHDVTQTPASTGFPNNKPYGESQIVELKDGRLMMISRLPKEYGNGIEISYSNDFGVNWSAYESGFELPYAGPSSKFHIQRLNSGNLLFLNNDSTSARHNITAWLSEDDGKTWPYKILLDDRQIDGFWGVSYPEAAFEQGKNDEIYIVYDAGRYTQKEIRLCILTEADIKAGEPISEYSKMRIPVVKCGGFIDIVHVNENYDRYQYVDVGVSKQSIICDLPTALNVVDETGASHVLNGNWISEDYNANTVGRYTLKFITADIPNGIQDGYSFLNVYVGVGVEDPQKVPGDMQNSSISEQDSGSNLQQEKGCGATICITIVGFVIIALLIAIFFIFKRKIK